MNESIRLGRIAGVPVGFNWSLLVIFALLSWALASEGFPAEHPGESAATYWLAAVVTIGLFFASLLAHEVGHAVVGRHLGLPVEGITLWLFGGVARLGGDAPSARAELRVAAVGPAISAAAAAVFALTAVALETFGASGLVVGVPMWLARINLILAVFNLMPAYPLDGGRVLRAILWNRHGDRGRATSSAARAGRAFGYALITLGLLDIAAGSSLAGVWFVFLGWFVVVSARSEEAGVLTRQALGDLTVGEVMTPNPVVAPSSLTVDELLESWVMRHRFSSFPLVAPTGEPAGVVTLSQLKRVAPDQLSRLRVDEVAAPLASTPVATADEPLVDLVARMAVEPGARALVVEDGQVVGIVSPTDVARAVQIGGLMATGARGPVRGEVTRS